MRLPFNGSFPITQTFGNVLTLDGKNVYAQYGLVGHDGIDYGCPVHTEIIAPHNGVIKEVNFDQAGYGWYCRIENEIEGSVVAHMESKPDVQVGFQLMQSDHIGWSGATGNVTGAHLHWGYYRFPRNKANGYAGFIDQTPYLVATDVYSAKHRPGDLIRPAVDIPVGASPGVANFTYGKVGPQTPALIIGVDTLNIGTFYNIDQKPIGGGTGWVDAKAVDATPVYTPLPEPVVVTVEPLLPTTPVEQPQVEPVPVTPEPQVAVADVTPVVPVVEPTQEATVASMTTPLTYTQEQWDELQIELDKMMQERNDALTAKTELQAKYDKVNNAFTSFVAAGFATVEDIIKTIESKDVRILNIKKELLQVLGRNTQLAQMVATKETEDSTAIDEGIKAAQEADDLANGLVQIAQVTETRPTIPEILDKVATFKEDARKAFATAEEEVSSALGGTPTDKAKSDARFGFSWLLQLLNIQ